MTKSKALAEFAKKFYGIDITATTPSSAIAELLDKMYNIKADGNSIASRFTDVVGDYDELPDVTPKSNGLALTLKEPVLVFYFGNDGDYDQIVWHAEDVNFQVSYPDSSALANDGKLALAIRLDYDPDATSPFLPLSTCAKSITLNGENLPLDEFEFDYDVATVDGQHAALVTATHPVHGTCTATVVYDGTKEYWPGTYPKRVLAALVKYLNDPESEAAQEFAQKVEYDTENWEKELPWPLTPVFEVPRRRDWRIPDPCLWRIEATSETTADVKCKYSIYDITCLIRLVNVGGVPDHIEVELASIRHDTIFDCLLWEGVPTEDMS